jgi:hypothetical protein
MTAPVHHGKDATKMRTTIPCLKDALCHLLIILCLKDALSLAPCIMLDHYLAPALERSNYYLCLTLCRLLIILCLKRRFVACTLHHA